jgi:hypothetical protein
MPGRPRMRSCPNGRLPMERLLPAASGLSTFYRNGLDGGAGVPVLANAVFVATVIFLALAFTLMGQLRFLIPWRALLWHEYSRGILFYCFLLFTNILGLTIWVERKLWLRDTGRKLKHLDQEIHSGQNELSAEILARFGEE